MTHNGLLKHLKHTVGYKSKTVEEAFKHINRRDFVLNEYEAEAYNDYPLPIGFGGTISQPSTVLIMLNKLSPNKGDKILDIGSGSGWTTALLAQIVGRKGKVFGMEIVPQLVEFGQKNIKKYNFPNAKILQADPKKLGFPKEAPFDKILVSAAARELPQELVDQLNVGGRMVIPIESSVWQIDKISEDEIQERELPGFAFVPLK